jgi:short-subunit dehydrogenase involved in D-alanine esterification of teichoic acids
LEFTTNYFAYLALTKELIPYLHSQNNDTALVYISSGLALLPLPPRSNYCATKAALHQWILSLRVSLQNTDVKVIEIYPPAVQTELHDEKHQPDIKNGRSMGMPLGEFTQAVRQASFGVTDDMLTSDRPGTDSKLAKKIYLLVCQRSATTPSRRSGGKRSARCSRT